MTTQSILDAYSLENTALQLRQTFRFVEERPVMMRVYRSTCPQCNRAFETMHRPTTTIRPKISFLRCSDCVAAGDHHAFIAERREQLKAMKPAATRPAAPTYRPKKTNQEADKAAAENAKEAETARKDAERAERLAKEWADCEKRAAKRAEYAARKAAKACLPEQGGLAKEADELF